MLARRGSCPQLDVCPLAKKHGLTSPNEVSLSSKPSFAHVFAVSPSTRKKIIIIIIIFSTIPKRGNKATTSSRLLPRPRSNFHDAIPRDGNAIDSL